MSGERKGGGVVWEEEMSGKGGGRRGGEQGKVRGERNRYRGEEGGGKKTLRKGEGV